MGGQNQDITLKAAGLFLSPSDFGGATPPGGLNVADNVVVDQQDLLQPRRGFESLGYSFPTDSDRAYRLVYYNTVNIAKTAGKVLRLDPDTGWIAYDGVFNDPGAPYQRSRFLPANKNVYMTSDSGIYVLDSPTSQWAKAGIPAALDLEVATTGVTGWFNPNIVATTTAEATTGSPELDDVGDITGIVVGQYVTGPGIPANTVVETITPSDVIIQQVGSITAGSSHMSVASSAGIVAGVLVSGVGIPAGTTVESISGTGPYTVVMSAVAFQTDTTDVYTFSSSPSIILSQPVSGEVVDTIDFPAKASAAGGDYLAIYDTDGNGWAAALNKSGSDPAPSGAVWASIASGKRTNVNISSVSGAYAVATTVMTALQALTGFNAKFTLFQAPNTGVAATGHLSTSISAAAASLTMSLTGSYTPTGPNLTLTAATPGSAGNSISLQVVQAVVPGSITFGSPPSITGTAIQVSAGCDARTGTRIYFISPLPTASSMNGNPSISALVTTTTTNTTQCNSPSPITFGPASLIGGVDASALDLSLTAASPGASGNAISISIVDDGSTSRSAAVSVTGNAITVTLAKSAGLVTTTNAALVSLINGDPSASALVTVSSSLTTDIVAPLAGPTSLTGGVDPAIGGEITATRTSDGPVDPTTFHNTGDTGAGSITGTQSGEELITVSFFDGSQVGYRHVFGIFDANNNLKLGAPGQFAIVTNTTGNFTNVAGQGTLPEGLTTNHFVQVYRTQATAGASVPPIDQEQQVYEAVLTGTDLTNGFFSFTDITPDSLKGQALYTGNDQQGILQANAQPPLAMDFCSFSGMTFYANVITKQSRQLSILAVGSPNGLQPGDILTIGSVAYTAATVEDVATNRFQVFTDGTPAQNITDTTNSLIRVVNRSDSNTTTYASLLTSQVDLPGQLLFQERGVGGSTFQINASAHGSSYTPALTPAGQECVSAADVLPSNIFVSKNSQPEAVPIANNFPVGSASYEITRILALREYVMVIKPEGLFKITGSTPDSLSVVPVDLSTYIIGADTATVLANQVWMLCNQGIVSASDAGVQIRSRPIELFLNQVTGTALDAVRKVACAAAYETDKKYLLGLPLTQADTTCPQVITHNYLTTAWTRWLRNVATIYVNIIDGRLYLGNGTTPTVSAERKSFTAKDFVDESFPVTVDSFDGNFTFTLASSAGIEAGDILLQTTDDTVISSEIVEVDQAAKTITVETKLSWDPDGDFIVQSAIQSVMQWKPAVAGNAAYMKQFSEGLAIFRSANFPEATIQFASDISSFFEGQPLIGVSVSGWGFFPWGTGVWGGATTIVSPPPFRFYIPQNKQYASQLNTKLVLRSAYADWQLEGISLSWNAISEEVA